MLAFPPFRLDLDEERLWNGQKLLAVRRKPMAILRYLITHPRRLVTHEELLREVWAGAVVSESAVRSHLHELRTLLGSGVIETVIGRGYRFAAELEVVDATPRAPVERAPVGVNVGEKIVGRADELAALRTALERARGGHRQICFVTGEPGIGKTTLVDTFLDEVEDAGDALAARGTCLEQRGAPEPYSPVIELVGQLRRSTRGDEVLASLVRYAPTFVAMVPHLAASSDDIAQRASGATEARMVRELLEALEALASQHVMVIVVEDLQWSDVATIDLLASLGQRRERAKLLVIATSRRAEAQTVAHPLNGVMRTLVARGGATAIALDRIAATDVERLVERRFPSHAFPPGFVDVVDRITAGTPLYVVTFLDDVARRGMLAASLEEIAAHRPDNLKQLIDIQIDRLDPQEQRVLEAAGLIGIDFSTALVAAALELGVEAVDDVCEALARRSQFLRREASEEWPDGTLQNRFAVTHGLVREVCLERNNPSRRQRWHRAIAACLEAAYGTRAPEIAHVLAVHHDEGQAAARAIHYYMIAGDQASARLAAQDALALFRRARTLLGRLPASVERDAMELRILGTIGSISLGISEGILREPLEIFEQTVALARRLDDAPRLYKALCNFALRHSTLAQHRLARGVIAELIELEQRRAIDPRLLEHGSMVRAFDAMHRGDLATSQELFERLCTGTETAPKPIVRMAGMIGQLAVVCCLRGDRDRALREARRAVELTTGVGEPFSLGVTLVALGRVQLLRRDPVDEIRATADAILAAPDGMARWARYEASILVAYCDAHTAPLEASAIAELVQAFRTRMSIYPINTTAVAIPLVIALQRSGLVGDAVALVDEMLAFARDHGELAYEPELLRLRDELHA